MVRAFKGEQLKSKPLKEYPDYYPSDEPLRRCPDINKAIEVTNIEPQIDLDLGIKKMYKYFINEIEKIN